MYDPHKDDAAGRLVPGVAAASHKVWQGSMGVKLKVHHPQQTIRLEQRVPIGELEGAPSGGDGVIHR